MLVPPPDCRRAMSFEIAARRARARARHAARDGAGPAPLAGGRRPAARRRAGDRRRRRRRGAEGARAAHPRGPGGVRARRAAVALAHPWRPPLGPVPALAERRARRRLRGRADPLDGRPPAPGEPDARRRLPRPLARPRRADVRAALRRCRQLAARRRRLDRARPGALHRGLRGGARGVGHRPRRSTPRCCARSSSRRRRTSSCTRRGSCRRGCTRRGSGCAGCSGTDNLRVDQPGFAADILREPAALADLLDRYSAPGGPLAGVTLDGARRVLLLGMGSSQFAAQTAAALLRSAGRRRARRAGLGGAAVPALGRHARDRHLRLGRAAPRRSRRSRATTARAGRSRSRTTRSASSRRTPTWCCRCWPAPEEGGIACRSFQATLAVLHLLAGVPADALRPAAVAPRRRSSTAAARGSTSCSRWSATGRCTRSRRTSGSRRRCSRR